MSKSEDDGDVLVVLAVLAHQNGINAVAPEAEEVAQIQILARAHGEELGADHITRMLKQAQVELLKRQLSNRE